MSAVYHEIHQTKPFRSLEEEVYIAIRLTSQVMDQPWAQYLRKTEGISPSQYNLLRILRGAGADGRTMREVAERMINRDPDVTRLADRTLKLGLARRMRDTEDRRVVKLFITEKGLEMLARLDDAVAVFLKQVLGGLGPKRLRMLRDLLGAARAGFGLFPVPGGSK
ncbi:MAG: MarR family winged helix-turn-helix transcriptional regulator [Gammaproteobacteria bacterium]